jgi:hypothetical protein
MKHWTRARAGAACPWALRPVPAHTVHSTSRTYNTKSRRPWKGLGRMCRNALDRTAQLASGRMDTTHHLQSAPMSPMLSPWAHARRIWRPAPCQVEGQKILRLAVLESGSSDQTPKQKWAATAQSRSHSVMWTLHDEGIFHPTIQHWTVQYSSLAALGWTAPPGPPTAW